MKQALLAAALAGIFAYPAGADTAPKGYDAPLSPMPHNFRYTSFPEPVRWGRVAERYELRNGDCGGSDCGKPRYRAEVQEKPRRATARIDRDIWYGWSFRSPVLAPVPRDAALRLVLGQWRLSPDLPPVIRLIQLGSDEGNFAACADVCTPSPDAGRDVVLHLDDMATTFDWGRDRNSGYICRLFSTRAAQSEWQDIVINTNFGSDDGGYLRIWVNEELVCDYRGRMAAHVSTNPRRNRLQHRRGIFSSYTKRWETRFGLAPKPTLVAYYDEFLSGTSRDAVDTRLRELNGSRPKD
ncbi:heparin lyase I family protein [Pseudaestuariivita atlantica]|uniref:Lipoprotein n=1 Tax=Pseudaestuariivita atlantica TaxID=1317121 RepID=A0A0L1JNG5_9RHOB|nr:heparin lyase I family protein [Pseudaestuariivita atlantica]KNG93301.1 hypothetical protein ATO11_12705 [Pseudaestuariivita atlantica]